jgi:hypothetical protein
MAYIGVSAAPSVVARLERIEDNLFGNDTDRIGGLQGFDDTRCAGWVSVTEKRFAGGADPTGATSSKAAIEAAITAAASTVKCVLIPNGIFMAAGLTVPDDVTIMGLGRGSILKKNANGAVLSLGRFSNVRSLYVDGNGGSYTGVGVTVPFTAEFEGFQRIESSWIRGTQSYCVEYVSGAAGAGFASRIATTDLKVYSGDSTPAVKWGADPSNSHGNRGIIACTAGSGPIVDASGSDNGIVMGCEIGGTTTQGVITSSTTAKITVIGNRLAAPATITVDGINVTYTGNHTPAAITIAGTSSGAKVIGNSSGTITLDSGAVQAVVSAINPAISVVDNSGQASNAVDIPLVAYTPTWTTDGTAPALGDGTLAGYYSRTGKLVTASVVFAAGASTTFGTGEFRFSLPFTPSASQPFIGSAVILDAGAQWFVGSAQTRQDGANLIVYPNAAAGSVTSLRPMTWAAGDTLRASVTYSL